jgi:hypothetical protein
MLNRIREQIGTAGLIVAVAALVAALSGGAYAASQSADHRSKAGVDAKTKKEIEKYAKRYAKAFAKEGPPGPAAPAGPAGANGARGETGLTGSQGPEGPSGETGFTETLPPGKTETGAYAAFVQGEQWFGIPFAIPLAAPLGEEEVHFVTYEEQEEEEVPQECTVEGTEGSVAEPLAAPGQLCVYERPALSGFLAEQAAFHQFQDPSATSFGVEGAATAGTAMFMTATATYTWGTWAVTEAE